MAFSPDAARLVSASGKSTRIWDAATGKQQREVTYSYQQTYLGKVWRDATGLAVVALTPDGIRLATCDDKAAQIWDIAGA